MNLVTGTEFAKRVGREALIDALGAAFRSAHGAPARSHHTIPVAGGPDATLLLMPAWMPGRYVGAKIAQVFPGNGARGLPAVQSVYLLFSGETGELLAAIEGAEITTRRTVAASSLALRHLGRADTARLLVVGTGQVARQIPASHRAVRPITEVEVWGRARDKASELAAELRGEGFAARAVSDLAEAAARADVVSCCTLSRAPLVLGDWLRPGTHVDLIGGFTPAMREVDDAAVTRATLFIDTPAALHEAGDLVIPLRNGVISREAIAGDLADLASGRHPGRQSDGEITLFKSVGAAVEDLAAAVLWHEGPSARRPD